MAPAVVEEIAAPGFGALGWLVRDTALHKTALCGMRLSAGLTLEELSLNASTQTKKLLFTGVPCDGAKAGMVLTEKTRADLHGAFIAFGHAISEHVRGGLLLHRDMGLPYEFICDMNEGAGIPSGRGRTPLPTHEYAAWSIAVSIGAALDGRGMGWPGCRVAIDGFGEVGSALAKLAAAKGAKITSISNSRGSIYDDDGLDAGALAGMREKEGGEFIRRLGPAPSDGIFSKECDVFVPCARSLSVTDELAPRIRAPIIVAGANAPMLPRTERALWRKGKTIVPDGVSNCGGVLLGWLKHFAKENDEERIGLRLRGRVEELLSCGEPPSDFLAALFRRRLAALRGGKSPTEGSPDSLLPPLS
ncbi:MAG: hypothetical protein AB1324_03190 [Candidatus Micrarchaeota archaeon]